MIIAISGKIGVGKDTVGEIIQKLCATNNGPQFEIKKFAGKLKTIASLLTGVPVEKFEDQKFKMTNLSDEWSIGYGKKLDGSYTDVLPMTYREFLQNLGTEAMRDNLHENVWVNALFADYKAIERVPEKRMSIMPNWIITDMRFENELESVVLRNGITIRVVRPGTAIGTHPSETALDDAEFDYVINNNGTVEELIQKVREILIKEKIL